MSVFSEVPEQDRVAQNSLAFAFRDRFPVSPGHTLVVSRREIPTWWQATSDERLALLDLVDAVKTELAESHRPDGFNVGFNAGSAAGQTIDHLHLHVIPRYAGDIADPRGGIRHVIPRLGNYLVESDDHGTADTGLVTPANDALYRQLTRCLRDTTLDRIDLVVSFVMRSGINLIARHIDSALDRGARIRLLTTDYLLVTDPGALGFFVDRSGEGRSDDALQARVFSDPATSFHPKAYIFSSSAHGGGVAFVGSSNLSLSGLRGGVEWNVRYRNVPPLLQEFEELWADPRCSVLTRDWLSRYQTRRIEVSAEFGEDRDTPVTDEPPEPPITPWSVQQEALSALELARAEGHRAGLVVMATGLGKTWLAAFDSTRPEFRRVLFVAHRDEILKQARDVYRAIRPDGRLTMFTGATRDGSGDVVFATVQSLHRNLGGDCCTFR